MKYLSERTCVLAVLMGLFCSATAVAWIAASEGGDGAAMERREGSHRAAPAAKPAAPSEKSANQVIIDNFKFEPRHLTVAAGTMVTWINRDDVPHTATSTARPKAFDSKTLDTDGRFSHVFATPGTYEYFCAVHPHMKGKIVVK
jgi:plastocyanin